jgi:hypothetical protein
MEGPPGPPAANTARSARRRAESARDSGPAKTQCIFRQRDLPLRLRYGRGNLRFQRRGPRDLKIGRDAALLLLFEDTDNVTEGVAVTPGDLQFHIEVAELKVILGHVGDETLHHAAARLFGGEEQSGGRLAPAPDASPEVQLPRGASRDGKGIGGLAQSAGRLTRRNLYAGHRKLLRPAQRVASV